MKHPSAEVSVLARSNCIFNLDHSEQFKRSLHAQIVFFESMESSFLQYRVRIRCMAKVARMFNGIKMKCKQKDYLEPTQTIVQQKIPLGIRLRLKKQTRPTIDPN